MTPWPWAAAAYPQTLYVTRLVAPVYSGRRSNDMFLIKFFLKLGSSLHFPHQNSRCAALFLRKLTVAIFLK